MKTPSRWLGRAVLALFLFLLLVAGIMFWLLGSDRGFRLMSEQLATHIDSLQLERVAGNLISGISADRFSFTQESLEITANGLIAQWQLPCLKQRMVCLQRLSVDELLIETFPTPDDAPVAIENQPVQLPQIKLPLDLTISDLFIRRLTLKSPGELTGWTIENIHLRAATNKQTVALSELSLVYQEYVLRSEGQVQLHGDYPLDLTVQITSKDVIPDSLAEGGGEQPANLVVGLGNSVRDLSIDARLSGIVEASLKGQLAPLNPDLPAILTLQSDALGWPLVSREEVQINDLNVIVDGTRADYQLTLATAIAGKTLPATRIDAAGRINSQRVLLPHVDIQTLSGTAKALIEASWTDGIDWHTHWQLADIDPSQHYPGLSGQLQGEFDASGRIQEGKWTLSLPAARIHGTLRDYPLTVEARLNKDVSNTWQINQLTLDQQQNRIDARGRVSDQWDLSVDVVMPRLENLHPQLSGEFDAALGVSGPLTEPTIDLKAHSRQARFNDIELAGISLKAEVNRLLNDPSRLVLAIGTVSTAEQLINNTRLVLDGSRERHTLMFFADGPKATAIDLLAGGSFNQHFDWSGVLDRADLTLPAHDISLNQPTALSWKHSTKKLSINPHCWVTGGTRLCLENPLIADQSGTASVTLEDYALQRLNQFLPAGTALQGNLRVNADIAWGDSLDSEFSAKVIAAIREGGVSAVDTTQNSLDFRYESLTIDAQLEPDKIEASLALRSENLGRADAKIEMNPATEQKTIDGRLSLEGLDIGILQAFLPEADEISGTLSANGNVQGQLVDPSFTGVLQLENPVIRTDVLPMPVTGGELTASIRGKRAALTGTLDSEDGQIDVDGSANWQVIDAWRVTVDLSGENLNLQREPLQESSINHQIRIGARPGIFRVSGNVDIPMARIDVADLPQGASGVSKDIIVIEDQEVQPDKLPANAVSASRLQVTLAITLGDDVKLYAYGLDTRLAGDMSLRLTSPRPVQLRGEISVVDGIYRQYGQDLEANGQILLVGPVNQTRLAIDAIREIDTEDRIAGLRIQGTVANPELTLFTEPDDKSENAILSYIVLGRDINEASDQDADLLSAAALALTVRGGRTIGSGIADALGVKDFALETRGSGDDTELVVSGRLNERLLLRYGRSVFEPSSTLYLRYDLTRRLYLEAVQGAERAVDLFYSFTF